MSTVHDTSKLRPYVPTGYPNLGNDKAYIQQELARIADAITQVITAAKALEARIVAGGL